jgi:hypothetical protein
MPLNGKHKMTNRENIGEMMSMPRKNKSERKNSTIDLINLPQ